MSPIGGQGMNIGWLDAWDLASAFHAVLRDGADPDETMGGYNTKARPRAARAIRRAEWYMALGRSPQHPAFRNMMLAALLHSPLRRPLARMVTLNGA
jgi:2-polyprenyl-6-methoxyphenol hydroxylase-like FAD-dependent oxidoreductase